MKQIDKLSFNDRNKLYNIKYDSKKGIRIHPDDMKFVIEMFEKFPKEFEQIDKEVNKNTMKEINPLCEEE